MACCAAVVGRRRSLIECGMRSRAADLMVELV
jgi:hypothetical protein